MLSHSLGLSYNYNHNSSSTQVHTTREDILGHNNKEKNKFGHNLKASFKTPSINLKLLLKHLTDQVNFKKVTRPRNELKYRPASDRWIKTH